MTKAKGDGGGGLCVRGRSGQREHGGGNVLLGDGRECHVCSEIKTKLDIAGTFEKEGFTVKINLGKIKVIKSSLVRSAQQCMKSRVVKHLGVAGIRQRNVLVEETNMTLLDKSGEYKKTFIGSSVGTGSVQVLRGVEFKGEPQEDHAFEVEPHGNVDQ
nr:hypothetical protein [Tanacetum cinerariifolium]